MPILLPKCLGGCVLWLGCWSFGSDFRRNLSNGAPLISETSSPLFIRILTFTFPSQTITQIGLLTKHFLEYIFLRVSSFQFWGINIFLGSTLPCPQACLFSKSALSPFDSLVRFRIDSSIVYSWFPSNWVVRHVNS